MQLHGVEFPLVCRVVPAEALLRRPVATVLGHEGAFAMERRGGLAVRAGVRPIPTLRIDVIHGVIWRDGNVTAIEQAMVGCAKQQTVVSSHPLRGAAGVPFDQVGRRKGILESQSTDCAPTLVREQQRLSEDRLRRTACAAPRRSHL